MIVDRNREKLIQAVVYFACHMRKLGKTKLFKLLYFLDFAHYRDTGRSVTGLDYNAWKMGPVPVSLHEELAHPANDWAGHVEFRETPVKTGTMLAVVATGDFDPTHFSRRELHLLDQLAAEYRDAAAEDMIEATHLENSPWDKVWTQQGARQAPIPYELALRQQDKEFMLAVAADHAATLKSLSK